MKKSLFAVAMAVILLTTNCQKTEIMNQTGTSIGFDSQIGKLTKAEDAAGLATLKSYGFRVWAYRNFNDDYFKGTPINETYPNGIYTIYDGMGAIEVKWDDTREWYTGKDYYWPGANKSLKFFAVSCDETDFSLAPSTNAVTPDPINEKIIVTNFEVKDDANNDLMVADMITQAQGDATNANTVKPVFRHTLTKVQFNFKTDEKTVAAHPVYVQSITTSALKNTGTLTLQFVASEDVNSPWSATAGNVEFTDDNTTDIVLPNQKNNETGEELKDTPIDVDGEPTPVGNENKDRHGLTLTKDFQILDTWLLLPQDISTATVTINYIIKDRWFTKTYPLSTEGLTKWDSNQFVKYNVTIAPNLITFSPTVEDWDTTDVTMDDNGTQLTPSTPVTPEEPTTTATQYTVTNENQAQVTITINQVGENPAVGETVTDTEDGTYTMEDQTVIVIVNGKVESITPATSTEPENGTETL